MFETPFDRLPCRRATCRAAGIPRNHPGPSHTAAGFLLVEAMVSILVIALALGGLLSTQREGIRLASHGALTTSDTGVTADLLVLLQLGRESLPAFPFTASLATGPVAAEESIDAGLSALRHRLESLDPGASFTVECRDAPAKACLACPVAATEAGSGNGPSCGGPVLL